MDAKALYDELTPHRDQFLERARASALYTIPYFAHLYDVNIDAAYGNTPKLEIPWNSVGTRGVQRLAARLLLALLPPNEPFFRLTIDEVRYAIETQEMDREEARRRKVQFESALSVLERAQLNNIAASNDRPSLFEILQHLIIGGNCLAFIGETLGVYHLRNYVVQREDDGRPTDLVIRETKAVRMLPPDALRVWEKSHNGAREDRERAEIYTRIAWSADGSSEWWQEICEEEIPGTRSGAEQAACPWLPLRMFAITGWNYSPGYVEAFTLGDLHTIDQLSQSVAEGSLGAARLIWGVKTSCPTSAEVIAKAKNGAVIPVGSENDIFSIQAKVSSDLSVAAQTLSVYEKRAGAAFSLLEVRDSERTTQEEVLQTAQEREEMFAALYMILSVEFCYPYVLAKFSRMKDQMPMVFDQLEDGLIQPVVSVGLSAIGRGNDLEKYATFIRVAKELFGPELAANFTNPARMFQQLAVASGLPSLDSVKTEDQVLEAKRLAIEQQQNEQQIRLAEIAARSPLVDPAKQAAAEKTMAELGQPPPAGSATPPMPS